MKRITIKSISIRNFKGIKELDFSFEKTGATISGENATGKTTIFDAFTWLLFGKDSTDRKEFGIIPLDTKNKPLEKVDNEVTAILDEDGAELTLRRVHHQKWVKKQGTTEVRYNGNETLFYYNGVPQKANEYKQKIEAIMDEGIFKLVTNPLYFNTVPWQDRRIVLTNMAGEVSLTDISDKLNGQADGLLEVVNKGKPVEEYRKEIAARKKKIKDDLSGIPTRIDELTRFMPEAVDEKAIRKQIDEKQRALDEIDQQIADANKKTDVEAEAYRSLRESLNGLKDQAEDIRRKRGQELNQKKESEEADIWKIQQRVNELDRLIEDIVQQKKFQLQGQGADQNSLVRLREQWNEVNAEELKFDEDEFSCPTCKRLYEADDIEAKKVEMTRAFNDYKKKRLDQITLNGTEIGGRVEQSQATVKELHERLRPLEMERNELNESLSNRPKIETPDVEKDLEGNLDYQDILKSIKELGEKLSNPRQGFDTSSHKEMKRTINEVLDDLKKQLTVNESRQKTKDRIAQLEREEKDLAQQLADLEKTEFSINEFIKARTDLIESRINDKFSLVRFKMFKQNINGGEEEACETLIDGVPFTDANNAAKINAGIDIINALSSHYGIAAPIWIDNRESINDLLPTGSQVMNLVVTKDKSLILS